MTDTAASLPDTASAAVELDIGGTRYRINLPQSASDYIQKKIATERQPYEREMLEDMRTRVAPGDLVLDIGANIGNHTLYLAAVAGCRVDAFEANAALCEAMRTSIALNGLGQKIRVHCVGVGSAAGMARFAEALPDNLGAQKLAVGDGEIEVVPLDSLTFAQPVRMLKIDVEGMEIEVLRGARALIARDRPVLYVECIGEKELRQVSRWVDELGYSYWETFNATPTHLFVPIESVSVERRLARLQLMAYKEEARTVQLVSSVRQKLTRAYDNEREAKQLNADLTLALAKVRSDLERLDTTHAGLARQWADSQAECRQLSQRLADEKAASQATQAAQSAKLVGLQDALAAAEARASELAAELGASQDARAALRGELDDTARRLASGQAAHAAESAQLAAESARHAAESAQLTAKLAQLEQALDELQDDRRKVLRTLEIKSGRLQATEERFERVRTSSSYLVGAALVASAKSLPAALGLPRRLWSIFRSVEARRAARKAAARTGIAAESVAAPAVKPGLARPVVAHAAAKAVAPVPSAPPRREPAVPRVRAPKSLAELKVACIFDEFTYHSFAPECQLLQLRADTWKQQLAEFKPDLLFIESAWRGVEDSWQKKVSDLSPELLELLDWAMQSGVSTAFWCKEDPVHFVRFLPVARLVDHVFTTDIDCIPRYMAALQHDRVHLLPFAAQPAMHNPLESFPREDAFCFAGSFYRKYPERQADFHELVTVGRKLRSVVIYDRNSKRPQPHDFNYPDEYRAELRDALDYAEVDRAYKGYRFGITVNTIKQSQTMFARRAFELMACNTVVVSNFSRGLRLFFGDLVVSSDDTRELEQHLQPVCAQEPRYRALRLLALRNVLAQHTYAHRLAYVVTRTSGQRVDPTRPAICIVAEPSTADEARRLAEAARRQHWHGAPLLLVGEAGAAVPAGDSVHHVANRAALSAALDGFEHVAVFDAEDHHGPHYLTDLVLATRFFRGDGLTKAAFHGIDAQGQLALTADGAQYRPATTAVLRRSLVRVEVLRKALAAQPPRLAAVESAGGNFLSLDEFSFCQGAIALGTAFDEAAVEAAASGRPPADLAGTILRTAEGITIPAAGSGSGEPFFALSANEIARLLPKQVDAGVKIGRDAQQRIVIESSLAPQQHTYLYLNRRFAPDELMSAAEMRFELESEAAADAPLNLCTVFVFRTAAEQKISQLTDKAGAPHALRTPAGTDHVRLALRVQGPGRATIGRLRIAPSLHDPIQAIPTVDHLVVARNYPAYDDLYRYAFVHARVRAYARAGKPAQVLCLGTDSDARFREFEGVDVTEADAATLDHYLATRCCRNVLVHIADPGIWEVVSKHLDRVRVTIWVHGAEIQPWWRRMFGSEPDASNDWARRTNDARLEMWREILRLRHPNLTVVFISFKQLGETLSDLRLRPAQLGRVEVIHNFVDTERFGYQPKPVELRKRVLSIRPYSSPVYGNDLAVKAIRRLAAAPFFGDLHFRIVGDGKLFDETVAPLRELPNVEISKGFLTQQQIAELHREYGIFLVPSRMDSQGVSRDEAMSSGLVPVTNRVAAIPDFVDPACGFLCEPEDADGLARAIKTLYEQPERFSAMSAAAAQRVRRQSGYAQTVARELALLADERPEVDATAAARLISEESAQMHIAIYGDVNLNIVDGSAVWAASLAETLAGAEGVRVTLLLKARVKRTLVLSRLLDLAPAVQLVEPPIRENEVLSPAQAVAEIAALASQYPVRAVVLRGLQVCDEAAGLPSLRGRLWAYLTDIPQRAEEMDDDTRRRIERIVDHSEYVLCQTPQMETYLQRLFPAAVGRTRILSPMIPPPVAEPARPPAGAPFRLAYAGKFAPRWGIEELFDAFDSLRADRPEAELHVYGDKIHQSTEQQPNFREMVQQRLSGGDGVQWHSAVGRVELMHALSGMHACWAFRDPAFERDCLELSTKALEYAALRVPVVLARSAVNESVFGADYPLFADSAAQAAQLLKCLAEDAAFRDAAISALARVAGRFEFPAVRASLRSSGVLPAVS